jgi:membrane associated rhomboid family serine protease
VLLPIRSKNPPESLPIATILLIVANTVIFFLTQDGLVIRDDVLARMGLTYKDFAAYKILTSMFLHGDIFHLLGNMWFLYLFGFAVEGRLRTFKFVLLYLAAGVAGDVLHLAMFGAVKPELPSIGASGAIMGCLGAALYMFPHGQVNFLFGWGVFFRVVTWKMMWVAAYYIGLDMLGALLAGVGGGVAHLAHIGGALGGFLMCLAFRARRDTEHVSEAKAVLTETKDLSLLSPRELEDLHQANPTDTMVIVHWVSRCLRDSRGLNPRALQTFLDNLPPIVREHDPKVVGSIFTSLALSNIAIPSKHLLSVAMAVEKEGDPNLAFRLYEIALKAPLTPEDQQLAVFRGSLLQENHYFNFSRAASGYTFLDQQYPMGAFSDQARSRLAALKKTGRV